MLNEGINSSLVNVVQEKKEDPPLYIPAKEWAFIWRIVVTD